MTDICGLWYMQMKEEASQTLTKSLEQCVSDVENLFPWVHAPLDGRCITLQDYIPKRVLMSQHDFFGQLPSDQQRMFGDTQPYPHLGKILDMMEKMVK
jgi:hypothetical protein